MSVLRMNPIIKWGDDESRTPGIDENACDSMNAEASKGNIKICSYFIGF